MVFDELATGAEELAQSDDVGRWQGESLKAMEVGSQGIGQDEGVAAVVLGTAHRMAVAESVDLFRVDGEDGDAALEKSFNDCPMGFFDGDRDAVGLVLRHAQEPIDGFR
jgi:hypothetical protein